MAKCFVCGEPKPAMPCVCTECAKDLQPMSCAGCRWEDVKEVERYNDHCMRCVRSKAAVDRYEPNEGGTAEAQEPIHPKL